MPWHVRRDNPVAELIKMCQLREPEILVVTEAVQEQDRRATATATAAVVVGDRSAVRERNLCQDDYPF